MFSGNGGSDEGDRPFIDLVTLFPRHLARAPHYTAAPREDAVAGGAGEGGVRENQEAVRLWRCGKVYCELLLETLNPKP